MIDKIKVSKDNITKEILKKDFPQYEANGWKKVENNNNNLNGIYNFKKVI